MRTWVFVVMILLSKAGSCDDGVGLRIVPKEFGNFQNLVEIKNLPNIRSQDGLGACTSFATAAFLDFHYCRDNKIDCSKITDQQRVSPLALAKFAEFTMDWDPDKVSEQYWYQKITFGGNAANTLFNVMSVGHAPNESCMKFDVIVKSLAGKNESEQAASFSKIKKKYNEYQSSNGACPDCADEIKKVCPALRVLDIKLALAAKEFEKFLYGVLVRKECFDSDTNQIFVPKNPADPKLDREPNYFPLFDSDPKKAALQKMPTVKDFIEKGKELLKSGTPFLLDNICLGPVMPKNENDCFIKDSTGQAEPARHTVMITGYAQVCDANGKCKEAFRVHNSWGQDWQDKNNNGWVFARDLMASTNLLRSSLSWLE